MDHDQRNGHVVHYPHSAGGHWPSSVYHSQQSSPMHEYDSFAFSTLPPTFPGPSLTTLPSPAEHGLLPLTPWPNGVAIASQHSSYAPLMQMSPPPQPSGLRSATVTGKDVPARPGSDDKSPVSAALPRKTLSDDDRRRMCEYVANNPGKKQVEVGDVFGVERSTVSKVLRHRDKYIVTEDESRSLRRSNGKDPDIERAILIWVTNREASGKTFTDADILQQAADFVKVGSPINSTTPLLNQEWLDDFKTKHSITSVVKPACFSALHVNDLSQASPDEDTTKAESPTESSTEKARHHKRQRTPKRKRTVSKSVQKEPPQPAAQAITPPLTASTNSPMAIESSLTSTATSAWPYPSPLTNGYHMHRRYTHAEYHPPALQTSYYPQMMPDPLEPYKYGFPNNPPPRGPHQYPHFSPDTAIDLTHGHLLSQPDYYGGNPTVDEAEAALQTLQKYLRHTKSSLDMNELQTIKKLEAVKLRPSDPDLHHTQSYHLSSHNMMSPETTHVH